MEYRASLEKAGWMFDRECVCNGIHQFKFIKIDVLLTVYPEHRTFRVGRKSYKLHELEAFLQREEGN